MALGGGPPEEARLCAGASVAGRRQGAAKAAPSIPARGRRGAAFTASPDELSSSCAPGGCAPRTPGPLKEAVSRRRSGGGAGCGRWVVRDGGGARAGCRSGSPAGGGAAPGAVSPKVPPGVPARGPARVPAGGRGASRSGGPPRGPGPTTSRGPGPAPSRGRGPRSSRCWRPRSSRWTQPPRPPRSSDLSARWAPTRRPRRVVPFKASTTRRASLDGTSTKEKRSRMSIAPTALPGSPVSLAMAPTRS